MEASEMYCLKIKVCIIREISSGFEGEQVYETYILWKLQPTADVHSKSSNMIADSMMTKSHQK